MHLLGYPKSCQLNSPIDKVVEHIVGYSHGKHIRSSIVWNWIHMWGISTEDISYIPLGKELVRGS